MALWSACLWCPGDQVPLLFRAWFYFFSLAVFTVDDLWAFRTFLPMSQHWLNPKLASARSLCDVKHFWKSLWLGPFINVRLLQGLSCWMECVHWRELGLSQQCRQIAPVLVPTGQLYRRWGRLEKCQQLWIFQSTKSDHCLAEEVGQGSYVGSAANWIWATNGADGEFQRSTLQDSE